MVKSVLAVHHQGLRDWIIQRLSAILMLVYSLGFFIYFLSHPDLSFREWQQLVSLFWFKISTIIILLCLIFHAWIGMWTVITDYIKSFFLSYLIKFLLLLFLIACFIWGLLLLWGV